MFKRNQAASRPLALAAAVLLTVLTMAGLTMVDSALADGMYVAPYGFQVYEPAQTAFIRHRDGVETLTILPRFYGDATDFAWVVPVPAVPEVSEGDEELFTQLEQVTRPIYRSRDAFWDCEDRYDYAVMSPDRDGGVEILDESLIGIYRTMILGADDAGALTDSLTAWGFLHEGNLEQAGPLLQHYVDEGWSFVTMQVDSAAVAEVVWPYGKEAAAGKAGAKVVAPYYYYPALQPITFTFASEQMIYPLRISSFSAYEDNFVMLYAASDHRMTFPYAQTRYANRFTAGEHRSLQVHAPFVAAEVPQGMFLTKLYRGYTPAEMDQDIILERAPDDAELLPVSYSGLPVWTAVFAGSVVWWQVRRRRRR